MIELSYAKLKNIIFMYILLPLWCFITLYLHSVLGGLFLIFLYILSTKTIKVKKIWKRERKKKKKVLRMYFEKVQSEKVVQTQIKYIIIFAFVAVIWSFLGGQGNLYYQSNDWNERNAIFRDIIYRDWPVIYPEYNKALVYYIGYWLPAGALTKVVGFILPKIYLSEQAFAIGNILLWIWTSIGIFLTELLLLTYSEPKQNRRLLLVPIILVFFSGMDIVGIIWNIITYGAKYPDLHLEWWNINLQFSSLTTCLFWVFNQTIVPWLAILCILQESKVCNYVYIGICTFAAGPIPMVGIAVYMILLGIYKGINCFINRDIRNYIKDIFSPVNCLAVLVLPIFLLYYKSNQALNNGISGKTRGLLSVFRFETITNDFLIEVLIFLLLEAGIYLLLLYRKYRDDIFYYITLITIFIAPFVKIGGGPDFVMRFSIPTVMVMAAMCLKFLINFNVGEISDKIDKYICIFLCTSLLVGAVTPITELFRGYNIMLQTGSIVNVCDSIKTFNQDIPANNFMAHDYKNSPFFKVFFSDE